MKLNQMKIHHSWPLFMGILLCVSVCFSHSEILNDDEFDLLAASRKQNISADYTDLVDKELVLNSSEDDVSLVPSGSTTERKSQQFSPEGQNFTNLIRISNLLDAFTIKNVGASWTTIRGYLGANCSRDMVEYFQGLQDGDIWAIKMDDASGHYTTGFFYGNSYFTGSMALCTNIYKIDEDIKYEEKRIMQKAGLSFNIEQRRRTNSHRARHINPDFIPGFYVLKVLVNRSEIVEISRVIYVGTCLPSSCSTHDVQKMAKLSVRPVGTHDIEFLAVRSPTDKQYDIWQDKTFRILLVVSSLVLFLMAWGTAYDYVLIRRYKNKITLKSLNKDLATDSSSGIGCTTYDLTKGQKKNGISVVIGITTGLNNNNSDENLAIDSISQDDEKLSVWNELLLSFSVITNFAAICDRSVGSDTIPSIHGLRAFSMAWVILGHTCIVVFKYSDNMELRKIVEKAFIFQAISNGAFSVDTFFFISGFLVSFIYFRTNAKGKLDKLSKGVNEITAGTFHFLGLVGYRFVRLTIPYIYILGVVAVTMKYFNETSVFDPPTMDHETCPKYWWRNVLYINTLYPVEEMCMLWSWYLADDTQFYIIGAIILIIAVRHFKIAASTLILFMISSWVTTAFIAFTHNHMPNSDDPLALFDKIYDKPWTRLGPYLIGMCVGWILFKTNCKIKMSRLTVFCGWILSSLLTLYLLFGLYNVELSKVHAAAYSSLSHSAWALSMAWITIACSTGYGGYVNKILSATIIYPFSRVTYCAYLVHPIVIRILALNSDAPLHLGSDSMMIIFFGQVVLSYILSFVVSLSFEAPVVTMLKIVSPNRKKRV